ncbi:ABC transporter [Arthrobacter sp. NQ7]|uniref:ABC transporter n=1 Tax=Arthrobacter sp. NQ7 TaxID=3032303 RepID=UPI002410AC03|nr:ABC transporter [Arthrobacter sp. NQ7]MDJ0458102.1 ABC transporter [Arthrobacter sp. NQ7]
MKPQTPAAALAALALLLATGCTNAAPPQSPPAPAGSASPEGSHGDRPGLAEAAEPPLHLVAIDAAGQAAMLDLLSGTTSQPARVQPPDGVTTDGRYVFAANSAGVDIFDSGAWTWDHVDHFHYYRAAPRPVGTLAGDGTPTIAGGMLSTAGTTGVFFPASGTAILLDNAELSDGRITEALRLSVEPHAGIIAPLGDGALVTEAGNGGTAARVRAVDASGKQLATAECPAAAGTITTRAGLVIGCADGAVVATADGHTPVLHHVPYPEGAAAPATSFNGRKGRPTVAGTGSDAGVWLLNTRRHTWEWLPTSAPVLAAATADDAAGHVVVVAGDGTVQVYDAANKERVARTEPLLAATLASPDLADHIHLTVDAQRAYVNAPAEGVVHEIDYADGARVARTLSMPTTPVHLVETGR